MLQQKNRNSHVTSEPQTVVRKLSDVPKARLDELIKHGGEIAFPVEGDILQRFWSRFIYTKVKARRIVTTTRLEGDFKIMTISPCQATPAERSKSANTKRIEALQEGESGVMEHGTTRAQAAAAAQRVRARNGHQYQVLSEGGAVKVRRLMPGEEVLLGRNADPNSVRQRIMRLQPGQVESFSYAEVGLNTLRSTAYGVKRDRSDGCHFRVSACQGGYQVHCDTIRGALAIDILRRLKPNTLTVFKPVEITRSELAEQLRKVKAETGHRYMLKEIESELWVGCMPPAA